MPTNQNTESTGPRASDHSRINVDFYFVPTPYQPRLALNHNTHDKQPALGEKTPTGLEATLYHRLYKPSNGTCRQQSSRPTWEINGYSLVPRGLAW
ncbi:hypothetical protein PspLS_02894 [Pyricularia sp. CBS 133598]|nr:hypothetical protein PspLS_02894 [Pyricularia sp. CBS 133598]